MYDNELVLHSMKNKIEEAFKSLIKSGRPDIKDEQNRSLIPQLYTDLYDNDYILRQVLDDNHVVLQGRRGTGKSTVFLQAENIIKDINGKITIYINLQSCYEEIKSADAEKSDDQLTKYRTYCNFFTEVVLAMKKGIGKKINEDHELDNLFKKIKEGEYIDAEFQRSLSIAESQSTRNNFELSLNIGNSISADMISKKLEESNTTVTRELSELRVFSIGKLLNDIKSILLKYNISRVYLFLDDFSELTKENQKLIIDSLVSPIISSYNDIFTVKLAAYPYRMYLGNIDSSKIIIHSLDFYDVYEQSSHTYSQVEEFTIKYVERTLSKRLAVFTNNQVEMEEIFDLSKRTLHDYFRALFYASSGIPRSLGYILTYCYLSSINQGKSITINNIESAAKKYYTDNILPDFYNDVRFKQSFFDDNKILDQLMQKQLMDNLIEHAKKIKRDIVISFSQSYKTTKRIFIDTIELNKKSTVYWLPTSHFFVDKDIERILQTLELYFIVSKFNEGSSRVPGRKISIFGLNYGLCLENSIDYGRPEFRRTYDYWRQDEFNFTDFIPRVLNSMEISVCKACDFQYEEPSELEIALKFNRCLKCGNTNSIVKVNRFGEDFRKEIRSWREISLPDKEIEVLRTLLNNKGKSLTAFEIGSELDRHHLSITKTMEKLLASKLVTYKTDARRHYEITDIAIERFFK